MPAAKAMTTAIAPAMLEPSSDAARGSRPRGAGASVSASSAGAAGSTPATGAARRFSRATCADARAAPTRAATAMRSAVPTSTAGMAVRAAAVRSSRVTTTARRSLSRGRRSVGAANSSPAIAMAAATPIRGASGAESGRVKASVCHSVHPDASAACACSSQRTRVPATDKPPIPAAVRVAGTSVLEARSARARSSATATVTASTGPTNTVNTGSSRRSARNQPARPTAAAATLEATPAITTAPGRGSTPARGCAAHACAAPSIATSAAHHTTTGAASPVATAAVTAAPISEPTPASASTRRSGTPAEPLLAADHGAGSACARPPAAAPRNPAVTASAVGRSIRPPTRKATPAGSAREAARSGARRPEIRDHSRQSTAITSAEIPAYTAGSVEPVPNRSFARTAHASSASSPTPSTPIASAVAPRSRRRSHEASTTVARVIPPMMSARASIPMTNHASSRKNTAAMPTSETPTISSSTGTVRRRRGAADVTA